MTADQSYKRAQRAYDNMAEEDGHCTEYLHLGPFSEPVEDEDGRYWVTCDHCGKEIEI